MPTTSEIKNGIISAHQSAADKTTLFNQARDYALANHTAYVPAFKAWKMARAWFDPAWNLVKAWDAQLGGNAEWHAWFAPFINNDASWRTDLDNSLLALLADMRAHAVILRPPAAGPASVTTSTRQMSGKAPTTLTHKPDGTVSVEEGGETATVTAAGEVEISRPPGLIAAGLAALALVVYGIFRIAR